MHKCPHCGKELPRSLTRVGGTILDGLMEAIGGPEQFAKDLAHDYENSEGHRRILYQGKVLQLVESEDKARSRREEMEYLSQSQERAILLEHTVWMIQNEPGFLEQAIEINERRKLRIESDE